MGGNSEILGVLYPQLANNAAGVMLDLPDSMGLFTPLDLDKLHVYLAQSVQRNVDTEAKAQEKADNEKAGGVAAMLKAQTESNSIFVQSNEHQEVTVANLKEEWVRNTRVNAVIVKGANVSSPLRRPSVSSSAPKDILKELLTQENFNKFHLKHYFQMHAGFFSALLQPSFISKDLSLSATKKTFFALEHEKEIYWVAVEYDFEITSVNAGDKQKKSIDGMVISIYKVPENGDPELMSMHTNSEELEGYYEAVVSPHKKRVTPIDVTTDAQIKKQLLAYLTASATFATFGIYFLCNHYEGETHNEGNRVLAEAMIDSGFEGYKDSIKQLGDLSFEFSPEVVVLISTIVALVVAVGLAAYGGYKSYEMYSASKPVRNMFVDEKKTDRVDASDSSATPNPSNSNNNLNNN